MGAQCGLSLRLLFHSSQAADSLHSPLLHSEASWVFVTVFTDFRMSPVGFLLANYMLICRPPGQLGV